MPLTRSFRETVRARAQRDPDFREALLREGIQCFLSGDIETGSVMYGQNTNKMFAGNKTTSINTGAGSVALSASAIQANGNFSLGGH